MEPAVAAGRDAAGNKPTAGRVVVVLNPGARAALGGEVTSERLEAALRARGLDGVVVTPDSAEDTVARAEQAAREGAAAVVAAGGDGTVHGVACGLLRARTRDTDTGTALGILPLGTMNNVAGVLGIPEDPGAALDIVAAALRDPDNATRTLDVGLADGEPFIELATLGLLSDLVPIGERVKGHPLRLPGALVSALRLLRRYPSRRVALTLDGRPYAARAPQITVTNTPVNGLKLAIAPEAKVDDGLLDVVVYERFSPAALLRHLLRCIGGPCPDQPGIRRFQAREIVLRPDAPMPLDVDADGIGDYGAGTDRPILNIAVEHCALRVCAPARAVAAETPTESLAQTLLRAVPTPEPVKEAVEEVAEAPAGLGEAAAHAAGQAESALLRPPSPLPPEVQPPRRAVRRLAALRTLYVVGLAVGVGASIAARRTHILPGDLRLVRLIQGRQSRAKDRFWTAIAEPGFPPWSVVGVVVPAALFWRKGLRLEAACMVASSGADGVNFVLKRVIRRERPAVDELVRVARVIREPSFPSGHVMHYVATFGYLAAAALANLKPSPGRAAIVAGCAGATALVGPSRVYLGAHWPSDVGAGYLFGGLYLAALLEAYTALKRRQARNIAGTAH